MRFITWRVAFLILISQMITGCGGGGSTAAPTQTVTMKLTTHSLVSVNDNSGFDLIVTLPSGASLATDATGAPSAAAVFLSGQFAGATLLPANFLYDGLRELKVSYASANNYQLGEFITIRVSMPMSYKFDPNDFVISSFQAISLVTGIAIDSVTVTAAITNN